MGGMEGGTVGIYRVEMGWKASDGGGVCRVGCVARAKTTTRTPPHHTHNIIIITCHNAHTSTHNAGTLPMVGINATETGVTILTPGGGKM